jgi:TM2 domain-containing membrane protein YozV
MEPQAQTNIPTVQPVSTVIDRRRHFLAVFFISFIWGTFGADRFYLGKVWTGILKLVTFGGFGLWVLVDLVLIMSGAMRDKQGNEMLQTDRYKKFAAKTILIFALILGAAILIGGIMLILIGVQLFNSFQDGTLQNLLPAGVLPDTTQIDQLQQLQDAQGL